MLGRAYFDSNNDNNYDDGEPILGSGVPHDTPEGRMLSTQLLTVWRKLFVEVDSMGAPVAGTNYGFDAAQPTDDPEPGNIADPPTSGLAAAFLPAYIEVQELGTAPAGGATADLPNETDLQFFHDLTSLSLAGSVASASRQAVSEQYWWTVQVFGVYEFFPSGDDNDDTNQPAGTDGNDEFGLTGYSVAAADVALIATEVVRDLSVEHNWTAAQTSNFLVGLVIHEVGHLMSLSHHIMSIATRK